MKNLSYPYNIIKDSVKQISTLFSVYKALEDLMLKVTNTSFYNIKKTLYA
jgi:hypothetical protein